MDIAPPNVYACTNEDVCTQDKFIRKIIITILTNLRRMFDMLNTDIDLDQLQNCVIYFDQ